MVPFDSELQAMSDEELLKLYEQRPRYPQNAGDMDWVRVAKEIRHRRRFAKPGTFWDRGRG